MPFCHLWDIDIGKENEHGGATWKSDVEKQHSWCVDDLKLKGPNWGSLHVKQKKYEKHKKKNQKNFVQPAYVYTSIQISDFHYSDKILN